MKWKIPQNDKKRKHNVHAKDLISHHIFTHQNVHQCKTKNTAIFLTFCRVFTFL